MKEGVPIGNDFFKRDDVVLIARELLGKYILTTIDNKLTGGIITETEAYAGVTDRASHAFGGRHTTRTEVMYREAGTVYVYLCYGIHSLVNIVTNSEGIPHAILLRSVLPIVGTDIIRSRRGIKTSSSLDICTGPGRLSQGMGITLKHNGSMINQGNISIQECDFRFSPSLINAGPRIGVSYAGRDALLPYRFHVNHKDLEKLNIPNHYE